MNFHTFGDPTQPAVLLIHGVLTPWQIWNSQIETFRRSCFTIAVALDAHEEDADSDFLSVENEAEKIEAYCLTHLGQQLHAVCGLSMGGVIAYKLWCRRKLSITNLILDGAPLLPMGRLAASVMTSNYLSIIHKSQKRDPRVLASFKRNFLPEEYLGSYLRFADRMSDSSVRNMLSSVCSSKIEAKSPDPATRILFLHGTTMNEIVSKRAAHRLQQIHPQTQIHCFKGCSHCQKAIYSPDEWLDVVQEFLQQAV